MCIKLVEQQHSPSRRSGRGPTISSDLNEQGTQKGVVFDCPARVECQAMWVEFRRAASAPRSESLAEVVPTNQERSSAHVWCKAANDTSSNMVWHFHSWRPGCAGTATTFGLGLRWHHQRCPSG